MNIPLDASESFAFEWAKTQSFAPEKTGPNSYTARSTIDRDVSVSALTPGEFIREVAAASARLKARKGAKK